MRVITECDVIVNAEASPQVLPAALKTLAAGLAAAVFITSSPAHAGVKFEKVVSKKVHPIHGLMWA